MAFLDSDDEWLPGKLALQRALLPARPDVLFCFSDFCVRDRVGRHHPRYLHHWHQDPRPWDEILGSGQPSSALAPLPAGRENFPVHVGNIYLPELERDYVAMFTLVVRRRGGRGRPALCRGRADV